MGRPSRTLLVAAVALLALGTACVSPSPRVLPRQSPIRPEEPGEEQQASAWRSAVVAAAERHVGSPYRYGGHDPKGFDCSGLVVFSYANAGILTLPRTAADLASHSRTIPLHEIRPGDLLFFSFGRARVSHVAIFVGDGAFVHAHKSGRNVERVSMDDPYWGRAILRAGRLLDS